MKIKSLTLLVVFLMVASACQLGAPAATATPTINATGTAQARNEAATQAALDKTSTAEAEAALATETAIAGLTATMGAQLTEEANQTAEAYAQETSAAMESTAAANPMFEFAKQLEADGYLTLTEGGIYMPLDDWEDSEAMINYVHRNPTFLLFNNFVFRANWAWESASNTANWWNSGCGITFRDALIGGEYYLVYLGLDGYANLFRAGNGSLSQVARTYAEKLDVPSGQADVALVVQGSQFYFFVNGNLVLNRQDTRYTEGMVGFAIVSGTNAGFGTRCTMTGIEFWTLP